MFKIVVFRAFYAQMNMIEKKCPAPSILEKINELREKTGRDLTVTDLSQPGIQKKYYCLLVLKDKLTYLEKRPGSKFRVDYFPETDLYLVNLNKLSGYSKEFSKKLSLVLADLKLNLARVLF